LEARVGIFKGVQGETEINPRISTELTIASRDDSQVIHLPTQLEGFVGINTLSSELALSPQQACLVLRHIWHRGEASDTRRESHSEFSSSVLISAKLEHIAEASIISTLSAVYLLQDKCQSVSHAQSLAEQAWRMR
ncbi:MAG: glycosyl transferase, partial [Shewanella sp.]|nr:glycosyl transferase [Shewanella sp.]